MNREDRIKAALKGGRCAAKFPDYLILYKELTGKDYQSKCMGCATKYLHAFLENWLEYNNNNNIN